MTTFALPVSAPVTLSEGELRHQQLRHLGRAVLACRCGEAMTFGDLRRPQRIRRQRVGDAATIEPIVCRGCAGDTYLPRSWAGEP